MGDEKRQSSENRDKTLLGQIYNELYPHEPAKKDAFIEKNLPRFLKKKLELAKEYNSSLFRESAINQIYGDITNYIDDELKRYFTERKYLFYRIKHKLLELNPAKLALLMSGVAIFCFGSVWAQSQFLTMTILPFSPVGFGLLGIGIAVNIALSLVLKESLGPEFSQNKFRAFSIGLLGTMAGMTVAFPQLYGIELASAASSLQVLGSTSLAVGFAIPLITGFGLICRYGWERYQANKNETPLDRTHEDTNRLSSATSTSNSVDEILKGVVDILSTSPARSRSDSEDSESLDEFTSYLDTIRNKDSIIYKDMIDQTQPEGKEFGGLGGTGYSSILRDLEQPAQATEQQSAQSPSANSANICPSYVSSFISTVGSVVGWVTGYGGKSTHSTGSTNSSSNNFTSS